MKKKILITLGVLAGLAVAVAIGVGIYLYTWYDRLVDEQPTVIVPEVTQAEINLVNDKIDQLDQSLRRREVARAEFTKQEINTAINHGRHFTALQDLVVIRKIVGDVVTVEASVPLDEKAEQTKYLNCEADLRASIRNGEFSLDVIEARSKAGDPLPAKVVAELEARARAMAETDPYARKEMDRVELLEFSNGKMKLIIKP